MTEWDPYYLRRGILRPSEQERRRAAKDHAKRREARAEKEERAENRDSALDAEVSSLHDAQQEELRRRLNDLQVANAEALIANAEAMEVARARLRDMLAQALVLPDGRRIFRTEDGTRVFDEHGEEISGDEVDPSNIADDRPSWEDYQGAKAEEERLEREQKGLQERQEQLDQAAQDLDAGALNEKDLDALEGEFGPGVNDPAQQQSRPVQAKTTHLNAPGA